MKNKKVAPEMMRLSLSLRDKRCTGNIKMSPSSAWPFSTFSSRDRGNIIRRGHDVTGFEIFGGRL